MESILHALDSEWRHVAPSPEARRALIRWTNEHDVFVGVHDLDDILACRRDNELAEEALLALARLAPTDQLAARTILQMLLLGLRACAGGRRRGRRGHRP